MYRGFQRRKARVLGSNRNTKKSVAQSASRDRILIQKVDLKVDDEGDDEDLKGFKSGLKSSQCVCVELICV